MLTKHLWHRSEIDIKNICKQPYDWQVSKPRDSSLMLVLFSNSDVLKKETPYAQGWEQGGYTKVTLCRNYNKITVEELFPYDMPLNVLGCKGTDKT